MKSTFNRIWRSFFVSAIAVVAGLRPVAAQSTAFTYNGRLTGNGALVSGAHDMQFTLYDANTNGSVVAGPLAISPVDVANGLFTVRIDFGTGAFTGLERWLEVAVRPTGGGVFTPLTPRQEVTSSPYAIRSQSADSADSGGGGIDSVWSVTANNAHYDAGNVGIGTSTPDSKLAVQTGTGFYGFTHTDGAITVGSYVGSSSSGAAGGWLGTRSDNPLHFFINNGQPTMTVDTTGKVGIGTTTPGSKLTVRTGSFSPYGIEHTDGKVRLSTYLDSGYGAWLGTRTAHALNFFVNDGLPALTIDLTGNLQYAGFLGKLDTVEQAAATVRAADLKLGHSTRRGAPGRALVDLGSSLAVNFNSDWGTTIIGGAITEVKSLRITGGADLAEPFTVSGAEVPLGSVVIIDEAHPGQLKLSTQTYDTRVAGIVSGANGINPGIALHQEGALEGGQNVALSGRVYVLADATSGEIKPGDLLTTSTTPGHAMKVLDLHRAQGAILGKAMSGLKAGQGTVLVLVTLQ